MYIEYLSLIKFSFIIMYKLIKYTNTKETKLNCNKLIRHHLQYWLVSILYHRIRFTMTADTNATGDTLYEYYELYYLICLKILDKLL